MAKATNLISGEAKKNVPQQQETQTITKEDVGTVPAEIVNENDIPLTSADSANGELATFETQSGLVVPSIFEGIDTIDKLPEVTGLPFAPYVACCSNNSKKYREQRDAGCEDGEFYLAVDGQIIRQNPMTHIILSASRQYWTKTDRGGNVIDARYECPEDNPEDEWQKHLVTILLIYHGAQLIPAKVEFRGTRMGAIAPAIKEAQASLTPEWALTSEAHKTAAGYGIAIARVVSQSKCGLKTSKKSGNNMYLGTCVSRPATVQQLNVFHNALEKEDFKDKVRLCKDASKERVAQFEGWCKRIAQTAK